MSYIWDVLLTALNWTWSIDPGISELPERVSSPQALRQYRWRLLGWSPSSFGFSLESHIPLWCTWVTWSQKDCEEIKIVPTSKKNEKWSLPLCGNRMHTLACPSPRLKYRNFEHAHHWLQYGLRSTPRLIMPVGPTTDPPQVQVEWGSTAQWATAPHCNEVSSSFETPLQTCQNLVGLSGKSAKMQSCLTTCHLLVRCRLQISGRSEV